MAGDFFIVEDTLIIARPHSVAASTFEIIDSYFYTRLTGSQFLKTQITRTLRNKTIGIFDSDQHFSQVS
jgi:hypothetical protein